jgi:hypothetical protein
MEQLGPMRTDGECIFLLLFALNSRPSYTDDFTDPPCVWLLLTTLITSNPNPLRERTNGELRDDVHRFHGDHKLEKVVDVKLLINGALIARDPSNVETCDLTVPEKLAIKSEPRLGLFQQTKELKVVILTTACAAIIQ